MDIVTFALMWAPVVVEVAQMINETNIVFPKNIPAGIAAAGQPESVTPKAPETKARVAELAPSMT